MVAFQNHRKVPFVARVLARIIFTHNVYSSELYYYTRKNKETPPIGRALDNEFVVESIVQGPTINEADDNTQDECLEGQLRE